MSLLELLYGLPGRVFRSEILYSTYDPQGKLLLEYQREQISLIVLLAEDSDCLAIQILGFSWEDALSWVRGIIPGAVEMPEQVQLIKRFAEGDTLC